MNRQILEQVEGLISYRFSRPELLDESLRHSSQTDNRLSSNERLEFLGDSVLSLVICQALYERFSEYFEGDLTKLKSMVVSRKTCSQVAAALGVSEYIQVGKGTEQQMRGMSGSIAAGLVEALIAAIYIDGGLEAARCFILEHFKDAIDQAEACGHQENYKSLLQQYCQRQWSMTPLYELLDEKGPDHNKCFEVAAVIKHHRYPGAWGVTKKDAEQKAAQNALIELGLLEEDGGLK